MYKLGARSTLRSEGVHPNMIAIVKLALSYGIIDFAVLQDGGVRTLKEQKEFVSSGASQTLDSKHLIQDDGYGHAIDIAPLPINWKKTEPFVLMSTAMFRAANELGFKIEWGGHYKSWKDYPHFNGVGW